MTTTTPLTSVYDQLGATPLINARGNNTIFGGTTPSATVRRAMQDSERYYVDMQQLLERSGQVIADLLECEAAYVTSGAAAALALGMAAIMAGNDPEKAGQLPDTRGMKNIVMMQNGHEYHYQRVVTMPGAQLRKVRPADFDSELMENVAAVLFPAHLDGAPGTLSLTDVIQRAHARNIPVLVDAAGRVYPIERFKSYTRMGADLVAFGAKYLGALNASGILCGRKDLVDAASVHGFIGFETVAWDRSFGRPMKVDRQTIFAVVAALKEWLETDHDGRIKSYERRLQAIASEIEGAPGVTLRIVHAEGPAPCVLRLELDAAHARYDVQGLISALRSGTPAIAVGRDGDAAILINPVTVSEEDDGIVASRLGRLLL